MPLIKNFRNEFGGNWASVYTATAKRHFVYKHHSDIKKGVTVTVEYKGETHTKTFSKAAVRAYKPHGRNCHPHFRVQGIVKWAKTFMKSYPDVWLFVSKVKIA